jgi:hypothetical protein
MDNNEYTVYNGKYNHLSNTKFLGYINYYYVYKIQNNASLNAKGH